MCPIYEYQCEMTKCGKIIEEYQSLHDRPLKKCPSCKKNSLIRIISLTGKAVVPGDPRDEMINAKREGKRMAREILRGNEEVIADVYGDGSQKAQAVSKKVKASSNKKSKVKRVG
jgi:putative FmdB family regulatory protein